jgi:hypothetical protein
MARTTWRSDPGPETQARMARAAEWRAAGVSWAAIGKKLRRQACTCQRWQWNYPAIWAHLYATAIAERDGDAESESIRALREMLRLADAKTRRQAANDLLRTIRRRDRELQSTSPDDLPPEDSERLEALLSAMNQMKEEDREINAPVTPNSEAQAEFSEPPA